MTRIITLHGHKSHGPDFEGEALVSRDPVHFMLDIGQNGVGIKPGHDLYNENCGGKILVFPTPKGGTSNSFAIFELVKNGCGPVALLLRKANPIFVQGAILAEIPIIDRFDQDPIEIIRSGDNVRVRPSEGIVEVLSQQP